MKMFLKIANKFILGCFLASLSFVALSVSAHDGIHEQIIAITKELKKNPNNAILYLKRAELFRLHEEWDESEKDFDRAEKIDQDLAVVNLGRGKLWLDTKQFAKAETALTVFLAIEPESYEGVLTMARVLVNLKQSKRAVDYFTQAITIAPKDAAEIYLERAEVQSSASEFVQALAGIDEGIGILGNLVTLQSAAIDIELNRNNYDAALTRLDKLSNDMPQKESFFLRRGEILLTAGRKCEAKQSFSEAQHLFENLSRFRKNVRAIKIQMERLEKLSSEVSNLKCD